MNSTILLVDDDPNQRRTVAIGLRLDGFHVVEAIDGVDALAKLETCSPVAVVSDIKMPRMDGLELLDVLQFRSPDLPCVLMSGCVMLTDQLAERGTPSFAVLPKSAGFARLSELLQHLLEDGDSRIQSA